MPGDRSMTPCAGALIALVLSACAGASDPQAGLSEGLSCVDDSAHCVGKRGTALDALVADKERAWVRERATAASYASGVRLFAFRAKKGELTCEELTLGRREAEGAASALRGANAANLTPAQVSRGKMLASEIARELAAEHARRCARRKS